MSHSLAVTDEMKAFLQEGLHTYAPAFVALAEFRRQVRTRLQSVLDEFSIQFSGIGLSVTDLKLTSEKLDDPELDENKAWIGLRKSYGTEVYTGCYVEWDFREHMGEQVWVGAWIYVGKRRADRDRLFGALQKQRSLLSKTKLEQNSDGTTKLSSYCDPDQFYSFDNPFRALIEEWVDLLSGVGGIQPFLSAGSVPPTPSDNG